MQIIRRLLTWLQNSVPTWFPHCPICIVMISLEKTRLKWSMKWDKLFTSAYLDAQLYYSNFHVLEFVARLERIKVKRFCSSNGPFETQSGCELTSIPHMHILYSIVLYRNWIWMLLTIWHERKNSLSWYYPPLHGKLDGLWLVTFRLVFFITN